jgi:molecular chaperone DnaK
MAADNKTLGRFVLDGIPPAPRGVPQIEVSFDLDANGILNVSAQDKATGREQHITITASSGLSEEEIQRMVGEAKSHEAEDRKRKDEIEARNYGDQAAYSAEKTLRDLGDKVPADVRSDVEAKTAALREALKGQDVELIRRKTQELTEAMQKIGAAMYEQPGATPPPPGGGAAPEGPEDEGTVEGEFREV